MFSESVHRALETLFSLALLVAFLFIVIASIGCGGEVKATTTKPTIIIEQPAPPLAEEAIATVPPPAVFESFTVGELPEGSRVATLTNREVSALTLYDAETMPRWTTLEGPGAMLTKVDCNLWTHAPKRLQDTFSPPKAAVKIDVGTYRACTCGDVCTCKDCPVDCTTVAANDCPGGVCRVQRSVIAKSSPVQASSDCASGGVRSKAKAAGGKVLGGVKAVVRFILRR